MNYEVYCYYSETQCSIINQIYKFKNILEDQDDIYCTETSYDPPEDFLRKTNFKDMVYLGKGDSNQVSLLNDIIEKTQKPEFYCYVSEKQHQITNKYYLYKNILDDQDDIICTETSFDPPEVFLKKTLFNDMIYVGKSKEFLKPLLLNNYIKKHQFKISPIV